MLLSRITLIMCSYVNATVAFIIPKSINTEGFDPEIADEIGRFELQGTACMPVPGMFCSLEGTTSCCILYRAVNWLTNYY